MLQYILTESDRFSVAELAQMAIEGGCLWISLHLTGMSDENIRESVAPEVVDMCKDAGVFLTIDDNPELARQLGLHGIRLSAEFLRKHPESNPITLREDLGPEAVIGVETSDPSAVPSVMPADIDFVSLPANFGHEQRVAFVNTLRSLDMKIPVVAQGGFTVEQAVDAIADGCNGVAIGKTITEASDPVKATESLLKALSKI